MEVPSSSGIPCITIEEDDLEFENRAGNNVNREQEGVAIKSVENSNDPSIKLQGIIKRLNSAQVSEKRNCFDELRAFFAEKSEKEFASLLFQCTSIILREKNACSLCRETFNSSYENIAHVILVHNVYLKYSILTKIASQDGTPTISKKNIAPRGSKNLHTDKFKHFLETCNRAKAPQTRINKYESLKKKYKTHLKDIHSKLVQNMFDGSQNQWICNNCKKAYKRRSSLAKHLYVEHRLNLDYESDSKDKKIKLESKSDDHKSTITNNVPTAEKGKIETSPRPPADDVKKLLLFSIYLAKSFPKSNLELLYELFDKLKYDTTIFEKLLATQNKFVEHMENNVSLKFIKYLVRDVGESTFSIFINQYSNGNKSFLVLVIKYFSSKKNGMNTSLYRFIQVQSENVATQVINQLKADEFNVEKCGGFGLDVDYKNKNLSNCIINDLKNLNSRFAINRCVSQSLQLIAEKACAHLPENLAIMIKAIYRWFENSKNREIICKPIKLRNVEPKSHHHLWFTELECIQFMINQWRVIKREFSSIDNCYTKYILQNLFEDDNNFIYLCSINQILRPILELQDSFSKELFDPLDLFKHLYTILQNLQVKQESKHQSAQNEFDVNIKNFSQYLVSELEKLIPEESSTLHQMSFLSPESAKTTKRMQCLPFSNGEVIRIFNHVAKFTKEMTDDVHVQIAGAFLILRCQNDLSFLEL